MRRRRWAAEEAVENAREEVAKVIGADAKEITFTSGATESNNLAIKGAAENYAKKGRHIITQATEHKAVLDPCKKLQSRGCEVTYLGVDKTGQVSLEQLAAAIRPDTILVSVMYANNEIGTVEPIAELGAIAGNVPAHHRPVDLARGADCPQALHHLQHPVAQPGRIRFEPTTSVSQTGRRLTGSRISPLCRRDAAAPGSSWRAEPP